jgi:hypothetical protein
VRRGAAALAVVALAALVALGMLTGTTASPADAPQPGRAPVTSATLVCPEVNGSPPGTVTRASIIDAAGSLTPPSRSTGTVTATVLAGHKSKSQSLHPAPVSVVHSVSKTAEQVAVAASGSVAASLAADVVGETATGRARAMLAARCAAPATDWWFTGAEGRVGFADVLVLANPSPAAAQVTISVWGQKGPHANAQLESLRVGARSSIRVPIASAAPDIPSVAVHVHATSGAVMAALTDHRTTALKSNGGDFIPPSSPPSRAAVVAGFAPGNGPRYLVVTTPGALDATVNLRMVTTSGSFAPTGIHEVVVRGGHSRAINVSGPLGHSTGAIELASDQPVIAAGLSVLPERGQRPDLMWSAAAPSLRGPSVVANGRQPDGGHTYLYLAAPRGAGQVKVTAPTGHSRTFAVPAGKAAVADITSTISSKSVAWPFVVTPVGAAPVYGVAAMSFAGAHGALISAVPLAALPAPIPLPAVREDPTVAVRN